MSSSDSLVNSILKNKEAAALPSLLESGRLPALVSGLSQVHRAHLAAALREATGQRMLIICPDDTAAENFAADVRSLSGIEVPVLNMREYTFYNVSAASRQAEQGRISALYEASRGCGIFAASATAIVQSTIPPEVLTRSAFEIENGGSCAIEDVVDALVRSGYMPCDMVEGPGQFSKRGGIVDFFSPASPKPVRMEFWGDEIDSMAYFDIESQRRDDSLDSCVILPAAETLPDLGQGGRSGLSAQIGAYAARYAGRRSSESAQKLAETMLKDAALIRDGIVMTDADRYLPFIYRKTCALDYFPDALVFIESPSKCAEKIRDYTKQLSADVEALRRRGIMLTAPDSYYLTAEEFSARLREMPVYMADSFTVGRNPLKPETVVSIAAKQLPSYAGNAQACAEDIQLYLKQNYSVAVLAADERRAGVLRDYLRERGIHAVCVSKAEGMPGPGECFIMTGSVSSGMEYPGIRLAVLTDAQLLRHGKKKAKKKLRSDREAIQSCADLTPGDYVVHENHGIGHFEGVSRMKVDGVEKDYIKISYAGSDVLYVPATQLDMVSRYTGGSDEVKVKLSKLGGTEWAKTRSRARGAAKEMAQKLINLYAQRLKTEGFAFSPDNEWQKEFEENFEYTETEDQLRCTREIKRDMEAPVPMDRLLCGDVGFGKTEVAFRAIMKCIMDGKQAALLVPTTVLAQQHYQTAMQRFFGFPVNIGVLSRMSGDRTSETLRKTADGGLDLVIGTHRLLSKDVRFKNLGLLVVDEEQRFGVTHKEHIKELSKGVDVLTLSATPIPRTLNMAMSGIRDMSNIEEPPEDRQPVQTFVMEHDWQILADAMRRELQRGGQVYYLHNRIDDIERTARRISELMDNAVVAVAHGQMDKRVLGEVMDSVSSGETQILVCTTIIETGIDIPNVNTLIIEDADRLGLAQLHQIRGRVGRSTRRASAYLTFRRNKVLTEDAEKRLNAIRDFAQFGSGIKIAMRDLEIRGAGSLLGAEQSGHMTDVGYDMYMKLLNEAVLEAKGEEVPIRAECSADLAVNAAIPESYIGTSGQRMDIYRRIAMIRTEEQADDLTDELIDRYGDPPPQVNSLVHIALLRGEAGDSGITDISQKQGSIIFTLKDFNMERVSALYAQTRYKNRLRVQAGSSPSLSLKLMPGMKVIEEARRFTADWRATADKSA